MCYVSVYVPCMCLFKPNFESQVKCEEVLTMFVLLCMFYSFPSLCSVLFKVNTGERAPSLKEGEKNVLEKRARLPILELCLSRLHISKCTGIV